MGKALRTNSNQPREKALQQGMAALGDAEILAILLRTGTRHRSALDLAQQLLKHFGSIRQVLNASPERLQEIKGIGPSKSLIICAMAELKQRYIACKLQTSPCFHCPDDIRDFLLLRMQGLPSERFDVLFLDNKHRLIVVETLFNGTINSTSVHPRIILQRSLAHNAAAVILAHNHPSGCATPSTSDIDMTHNLKHLLNHIDVNLLDHFIVGVDVISMAEYGLI